MILNLLPGPQDETKMPPSIPAFTTPYASAPAACNPYAPAAPSRDMPPRLPSILLMLLNPCHLPSSRFCITSIMYGGLLGYTINAIRKICGVAFSANRT
ncbi:hypothetical protein O181_036423 [Austropuccinia psidii MF-1]|uniref:Uncharacterized protein n=1 Tax=Austropuccinia psidii MF-1 TaxID=1389203 RepID=A0A9Q3D9G5_9BASI|nr:hypothetical protein [Austropuccinia psidii MF-1]